MTPGHSTAHLVLAAALLCAVSPARAQSWDVGVKTGMSRPEVASQEFSWSGTPASSIFLSRRLGGGPLSIQPELAYSRRSGVSYVGASTLRLVADYLEVPLLLHAGWRTRVGFMPFIAGGPSLSFRVRCRLQFAGGGLNTDEDCNERGDPSSLLDIGVAGAGGLAWTFGATTFSIESRVTAGLLRQVLPTDVSDGRDLHWSVLAGASVPLSRRRVLPPVWLPPRLPLPSLPAVSVAPEVTESRPPASAARRVTITADNADARAVLLAIAETGGIDVVVSPLVQTRVTAHLIDIPADQAIQAIADVTGLSVSRPAAAGGQAGSTVVFYQQPVDINRAPPGTIATRFGVSQELANFVVESRSGGGTRPR